ncbi:MAG: sigma 54-interacting transcriptional regulator [Planctomycetaceae bacterium]|nr:sigma 54-interacting transcriptional regulator [Planctomycetaceae bacterium]
MTQSPAISVTEAVLRTTDGQETQRLSPEICYRIGRSTSVEIPIRSPSASRLHAILAHDGCQWILQDTSSHGTQVNRAPLSSKCILKPGDVIRFGEGSEWMFLVDAHLEETQLAADTRIELSPAHEELFKSVAVGDPLIVGTSSITSGLRFYAGKAAAKTASVIIRGERGSGKRHVARFLHVRGSQREKGLVIANSRNLTARQIRRVFGTHGGSDSIGTVILDEFLDLPADAQQALYDYFQEISSMGGTESGEFGPRILSTTTRSPERAIDKGEFLSELFFKLGVAQILIDPLRDHVDDIPELAGHFARTAAEKFRSKEREFSSAAIDLMRRYHWPMNIAELRNVVERGVLLAQGQFIEPADLVAGFSDMLRDSAPYAGYSIEQVEKEHIDATLTALRWVKSHVAKTLGIERSTLDRKIAKYGLTRDGRIPPPLDDDDEDVENDE